MTLFDAIDEEMRETRDRARRRERHARQRVTLIGQIDEVRALLAELERESAKEDRDVARLEHGGFASFIAGLTGGREDRLTRERAEAAAVRQRVDGQRVRLEWLTADLRIAEEGLVEQGSPHQELDLLLARKERMLVESGDPRGRELADVAARLAGVRADLREHEEAHQAGVAAGQAVGDLLRHLSGARGAATWDVLGGGGLADMMKRGHLLKADEAAWHAQRALDVFARELADVRVEAAPRLPEVDTRWFADAFFDNIVTDALKYQRIAQTATAVQQVAEWVHGMVNQLAARAGELTRQRDGLVGKREELLGP
ncbi:hypothetical protein [Planotetraspora phitsanulokensis]|nr:hypothetical protein [Planotetraspora phitsanulokensis]